LFEDGLGKYIGPPAHIYLKPDIPPVFCRPRTVPLAWLTKVSKEIDDMVTNGVLTPVFTSE
jgi:hypothetical protein